MTFLFSKITGFACIRKDPTAALLCTARRTKGFSMECRQVRTCYDLAAATEESPTPSSRAEVEDCLSSLFSLWLGPLFFLGFSSTGAGSCFCTSCTVGAVAPLAFAISCERRARQLSEMFNPNLFLRRKARRIALLL